MGAVSSTVQSTTQKSLNSITQTSSAACSANCTQIQTGNVIFITGSNVGNVQFNQECTVNAKCQIQNSIDAAASAVQKALQSGSAKPAWFIGALQVNSNVQLTKQEIINDINQTLDSTCNNGATQIQSANLIYVQNSTTGDVGFNQSTTVNSQCILSNLAKGTASTTQQADNFAQAGGIGGAAIALIVIVIVIAIIIIVVAGAAAARRKQQQQQQQGAAGGGGGGGLNLAGAAQGARAGSALGPEGAAAGAALGSGAIKL